MRPGIETSLKARAAALGFSLVGVAPSAPSRHSGFYRKWLEGGAHGDMAYLARADAVARREDLTLTLEAVRSIVVVAHEYFSEDAPGVPDDPSLGVIARYARGRDYHTVVKKKLLGLLAWLRAEVSHSVQGSAYVDTGPILERELAARAGLGWFGKNTMLLNPRRGSWFFIGALLVDVELEPDEPFTLDHCGTCTRCLDACPTGALLGRDEDGAPVIDARRCISYLTIEHRGPIPRDLRPLVGNRIYGCDICQEACPFNVRFAAPGAEPSYAARGPGEPPLGVQPLKADAAHPGTASPSLIRLLEVALDEAAWDAFSRGSAIRRAGRAGFARNACVGLGNWGSEEAVPVLRAALTDPEPVVRAHALWALGRIGSPPALAALERHAAHDTHPLVVEEISRALQG
jgi:epoxyqueuosine reductase